MKEPLDGGERGEWNIWQANVCLVKARVFSEQDPVSLSVSRLHFHSLNGIFQRTEVLNFGGSLILVASTVSGKEHSPTHQQKMGLKIY